MISDIKFSKKAVEMGWLTTEQLQHCLKKQRQLWKQGKNLTLQECIKIENILSEDQISIIEQNCRQTNISDSPVRKTAIAPRMKRRQKTNHLSQQKKSKKLSLKKRVKQLDLPKKSQPQEEKLPETMPGNFMEKLDSEAPTAELPQNMGNEFLQKFAAKNEPQEKSSNVPQAMGNTFMQKFGAKPAATQEEKDPNLPPTMDNNFIQKLATTTSQGTAPETQEKSSSVPQAMGNTFMQKFSAKQTPAQQVKDSNLPPTMNNDLANKISEKIQDTPENNSLLPTVDMSPPPKKEQRAPYKKKLEIGEMFGHYKVEKLLGQGGMGIVYRALDTKLNRTVALKILSVHNVGKQVLTRFKQEALATAQLDHPNIVRLFEVDSNPQDYFTMEYVEGHTLDFHIKKRNLDLAQSAAIIKKIANALQEAHKKNIIHRDVKPGNILLDKNNQPKIMDFGLAKFTSNEQNLTKKGSILGTPNYMAPEQFKGDKVDKRADIYALGATLYEMITFSRLFDGQTPMSIAAEIFTTRPTPPRAIRPSIPENLEQICLKALEKSPKKRYLNAAFMAKDLDNFLRGRPTSFENTSHLYKAKVFIAANKYIITVLVLITAFTVMHWQQKRYYTQQIQNYKPLANKSIEALYAALQEDNQSIAEHSFAIIKKFTELQTPITAKTKNQFEYLCEYTFVNNRGYEEQGLEILRQFTRKESSLCNPSSALYIIEGIICEKLEQYSAASFAYQQAAKLNPENSRAHLLHGNYYAKKAFLKLKNLQKPNTNINVDIIKTYKKAISSWQKIDSKKQTVQQVKKIMKYLYSSQDYNRELILKMASTIHQSILHQWKE